MSGGRLSHGPLLLLCASRFTDPADRRIAQLASHGVAHELGELHLEVRRLRFDPTVAPAETHLVEIPLEMFRTEVAIDAEHGAVEDAAERFDRVGVDVAAGVFLGRVIDRLVAGKAFPGRLQRRVAVAHQRRLRIDELCQNGLDVWTRFARKDRRPRGPIAGLGDHDGAIPRALSGRHVDVLEPRSCFFGDPPV